MMNNNKKLGLILIIIGILLSIVLLQLIAGLNVESEELGCFEEDECAQIESTLSSQFSPIPIKIPEVQGMLSVPASEIVCTLALGYLSGHL